MADGTSWHSSNGAGEPRLGEASTTGEARQALWAVCRCGREGCVDPSPWMGQGLSRHALAQLEDRVRCACGARRLTLEFRTATEPPAPAAGIYVFR